MTTALLVPAWLCCGTPVGPTTRRPEGAVCIAAVDEPAKLADQRSPCAVASLFCRDSLPQLKRIENTHFGCSLEDSAIFPQVK